MNVGQLVRITDQQEYIGGYDYGLVNSSATPNSRYISILCRTSRDKEFVWELGFKPTSVRPATDFEKLMLGFEVES